MVTRMFEGSFLFGRSYPDIVAAIVALVTVMFVFHAFLAMRKFPANFQEYRNFIGHRKLSRHEDLTLWWRVTGLRFLVSLGLRIWSDRNRGWQRVRRSKPRE